MDVIEVIGLEIQAKPAGQAVDVVPPGGIPDQKDFSTLAGELLHHARFPAGIGLPGQDYQKGISSPERLLKSGSPAASGRGLEVAKILYLITSGADSGEKGNHLPRFEAITVDRIHQQHAVPRLPERAVNEAAWTGCGPLNLIKRNLNLGWWLVATPVEEQYRPDKKAQGKHRD